jgi:hypothetical protein
VYSINAATYGVYAVPVYANGDFITLGWVGPGSKPAWVVLNSGATPTITFTSGQGDTDDVSGMILSATANGVQRDSDPGTITVAPLSVTDPFVNTRLNVGYSTLQAAINAATSGDTIIGYPGTYASFGNTINGKSLTIKSSTVGQLVVLDATSLAIAGGNSVIALTNGAALTL